MKFYIPHAKTSEQTKDVYQSIKTFLKKELGADFSNRKIQTLRYVNDGQIEVAEVGQYCPVNSEEVIAILYENIRDLYHICTPNHGVVRGCSIFIGGNEVRDVQDFKNE